MYMMVIELQKRGENFDVEKYQKLVGTVHFDNMEGVQYTVKKVYSHRGLAVVDRVLYDSEKEGNGSIDTVHLGDVLTYPIIAGAINPKYAGGVVQYPRSGLQPGEKVELISRENNETSSNNSGSNNTQSSSIDSQPNRNDSGVDNIDRVVPDDRSSEEANSNIGVSRYPNRKRKAPTLYKPGHMSRVCSNLMETRVSNSESDSSDETWLVKVANACIEWSLTNGSPLVFEDYVEVESVEVNATTAASSSSSDVRQPMSRKLPRNYEKAIQLPEGDIWLASMNKEKDSLDDLKFGEIVDRPTNRVVMKCRWVYAFKEDENGKVTVYKSRVVIRGDMAIRGIDFFDTYSPVVKMETIRIALALIVMNKLKPLQVDVNTAYLQAELKDEVYMEGIPGFELPPGKVYRLLKSLYGLPQAGRNWNKKFEAHLKSLGFVNIREDLCIFILAREGRIVAIFAVYVDDFLIGTDSDETEKWLLDNIVREFKIKVLGLPALIVGISLNWTPIRKSDGSFERFYAKVHLSNPKTVNGLVKLLESKGHELMIRNTPADPVEKLSKMDCPQADQLELSDVRELRKLYQMVVGSLIWANTTVRFDINAALCLLCRFMSNPGEKHAEAMIWTVGY